FGWQTGQRSGRLNLCSFPVRRSRTGPSTCGITSPARVTSTQSPSRMSFASIRSKLWSVAVVTVTPPISTGSSTAYGLSAPVRPTLIRISLSFVTWTSGANLRATAQRGSRLPTVPSSACSFSGLTFTTTPLGPALAPEPQRNVHHRAEVGGDVFADQAVPARRADDEQPLLVRETHRGAVDLDFEGIARGADLRDEPGVAILPFGELRLVEGVGERQHRHEVAVLLERRRGLRADALRRAVGGAERGMLGLELLQLAEQAVVLGVGQLRLVEHVIGVVCALEEPPQLGGSCGRTRHRPLASS